MKHEVRVHITTMAKVNRMTGIDAAGMPVVSEVLEPHTFDRSYIVESDADAIQQAQSDYPAGSFTVGATIREVADSGKPSGGHDHGAHAAEAHGGHHG